LFLNFDYRTVIDSVAFCQLYVCNKDWMGLIGVIHFYRLTASVFILQLIRCIRVAKLGSIEKSRCTRLPCARHWTSRKQRQVCSIISC